MQLPLSQCLKIITLHSFKEGEYYFLHTWHMEHSQARWHGCVSHGHPTPGKDLAPGLPNLRPKYYPSPCHQQETTFAKLRHRSQIRAASILLLFGQGGTEPHDRTTCKYLSLLISSTFFQLVSLGYRAFLRHNYMKRSLPTCTKWCHAGLAHLHMQDITAPPGEAAAYLAA